MKGIPTFFNNCGLWLCAADREKPDVHVAGPFELLAETRDVDGRNWGILLAWQDHDGARHELALPRAALAGDGVEARRVLMDSGHYIAPGRSAREALTAFLTSVRVRARARAVSRIGWHDAAFVLPDRTIGGAEGERVLLQTETALAHNFRCGGSLADWQHHVAAPARGNSRLVLALSMAFAPPLLQPAGGESGGFHLRSVSSTGKSTALDAAGSVWGGGGAGYVRSWRTTANGLEGVAATHCDSLLCLDEIGQVDAKAAGETAYMLANGAGKGRAQRDGTPRALQQWRVLFLSSGETGLVEKVAEDGRRRATAGQQVRVLDVPADAGAGLGLFEVLHGAPSPAAFADRLRQAAKNYYGTAARAFLERLTADIEGRCQVVRGLESDFLRTHCPIGATGQVCRAAARFARVAAAGELAIALGILPWEPGEAEASVAACFDAWLDARGGVEPAEISAGIAQVRLFIEQHGEFRFTAWDDGERPTINRAGFRRNGEGGQEYYVLPQVWKAELCRGFDAGALARALAARGMLELAACRTCVSGVDGPT